MTNMRKVTAKAQLAWTTDTEQVSLQVVLMKHNLSCGLV